MSLGSMRSLTFLFLASTAFGGTITQLGFTSNGGTFINDTIDGNGTSPLGVTATTGGATNNPFLNNPDSTITGLGFGSYYLISFLGFGQHLNAGSVSIIVDSILYTENVTFPAASPGGVVFATFNLPNNEVLTIETTGLSADRIRVVANGGGLLGDNTADTFYLMNYGSRSAVPEPSTLGLAGLALGAAAWLRRRT